MIALFNVVPNYCPNCKEYIKPMSKGAKRDAWAHASHTCAHCGLGWQVADRDKMLVAAAESGGDMDQYH